jgi:pilus assembly protein CpaC
MKRIRLILMAAAVLTLWNGLTALAQQRIQLLVGQQKVIACPEGAQVNVGDGSIAKVQGRENQIVITGLKKGMTTVSVYSGSSDAVEYIVDVMMRDPNLIIRDVKNIFGSVEGVNFQIIEGTAFAKGATYTLADSKKLAQILELFPEIYNMTEDLSEKRMLDITISVVEISKIEKVQYNTNPPGLTLTGSTRPDGYPAPTKIFTQPYWWWSLSTDAILDRIAYWVTSGKGKVVANPTISVTDGDSAAFVSGGEIPFEIVNRNGDITVMWKEYGIIIKVWPTIQASGNVMLRMTTEVSDLDEAYKTQVTKVPALITRKTTTNNSIEMGQTVVLAGIYQTYQTAQTKRVPILGSILPFLFTSINNSNETKEIIVLATPNAPPKIKKNDYPMIKEYR